MVPYKWPCMHTCGIPKKTHGSALDGHERIRLRSTVAAWAWLLRGFSRLAIWSLDRKVVLAGKDSGAPISGACRALFERRPWRLQLPRSDLESRILAIPGPSPSPNASPCSVLCWPCRALPSQGRAVGARTAGCRARQARRLLCWAACRARSSRAAS